MILASRGSFPSAKLFRDSIYKLSGKRLLVTLDPTKVNKLHIRYGNSSPVNCEDTEFNSPEFIQLLSNKKSFSDLLVSNEFPTIVFKKGIPTDFPVLIRKTLSGQGGSGIVASFNLEHYQRINGVEGRNYFYSPYIPFESEFRVHIFSGEVIKIFRKTLHSDPNPDDILIRNNDSCNFTRVDPSNFNSKRLVYFMETVANDLHISNYFLGLDIGLYNGRFYIIEGNSAPGLNEYTAEEYASKFLELYKDF
jgi:glutathione synthase/RimK-type ligase-like ATP-grasp enzyme